MRSRRRGSRSTMAPDTGERNRNGPNWRAPSSPSRNGEFVSSRTSQDCATDCIQEGRHGLMMAISSGCYAAVPIPDPKLGPRKVEIETMYNTARYRPNYACKLGLPIFLTRA